MKMYPIFEISYTVYDKGCIILNKTKEVAETSHFFVEHWIQKDLRKYRRAHDISRNFKVEVLEIKKTNSLSPLQGIQ